MGARGQKRRASNLESPSDEGVSPGQRKTIDSMADASRRRKISKKRGGKAHKREERWEG